MNNFNIQNGNLILKSNFNTQIATTTISAFMTNRKYIKSLVTLKAFEDQCVLETEVSFRIIDWVSKETNLAPRNSKS